MSYTILLVEDNPHIMEINHEALEMSDYRVLEARDGRACMLRLQENDIDLIVLDIMLPDADGLALCRKIKAQYDIPILFLSALGENEQIIEGLRASGDDYLPKPYDIGVLLARVEARLRASQRERRVITYGGLRMDTVIMKGFWRDQDLMLRYVVCFTTKHFEERRDSYAPAYGNGKGLEPACVLAADPDPSAAVCFGRGGSRRAGGTD